MAIQAYLKLKGQKQGQIKGSSQVSGREDDILVFGVVHEIISPRDLASGQATGRRMHKPLTITKELDKSSPPLHLALASNENINEFELKFYGVDSNGVEQKIYTIKLEDAVVSSIHFEKANIKKPENVNLKEFEIIGFTYQSIQWIWEDGNIMAQDDWEIPT